MADWPHNRNDQIGGRHASFDRRTGTGPSVRGAGELWSGSDQITRETTFEELDIDSLDLVELAQIVEDEYGMVLKGEDMKELKTVGDAIDLIVSRAE